MSPNLYYKLELYHIILALQPPPPRGESDEFLEMVRYISSEICTPSASYQKLTERRTNTDDDVFVRKKETDVGAQQLLHTELSCTPPPGFLDVNVQKT